MVLLSEHPILYPPEDELVRLQAEFLMTFKQHIFVENVDVTDPPMCSLPPYLQLAISCLSLAVAPEMNTSPFAMEVGTNQRETCAALYVAGVNLWSVMLEIDNREARLLEAVVAVRATDFGV